MGSKKKSDPVFCFHSVRSTLAIPPARVWPSERLHGQMCDFLHVTPSWFEEWLPHAHRKWPDLTITFDDGFRDVIVPAIAAARRGIKVVVFIPTSYIGQMFPFAPYDVMSSQEIAFLANNGVLIGSHGHQHCHSSSLALNDIHFELTRSMDTLKFIIGCDIELLAPPFGEFDLFYLRIALELGYEHVYGTVNELGTPAGKVENTTARWLANMEGYIDGKHGVDENAWEW